MGDFDFIGSDRFHTVPAGKHTKALHNIFIVLSDGFELYNTPDCPYRDLIYYETMLQ